MPRAGQAAPKILRYKGNGRVLACAFLAQMRDRALLADTGLVLEPDLKRFPGLTSKALARAWVKF